MTNRKLFQWITTVPIEVWADHHQWQNWK